VVVLAAGASPVRTCEARALALSAQLHVGPELLWAGRAGAVRGFINGVARCMAKPHGDAAYSLRQAGAAKMHRAGICHNDLAKEQNWLRAADGRLLSRTPARR
jgi:predicted Ser/Thr protein kinase